MCDDRPKTPVPVWLDSYATGDILEETILDWDAQFAQSGVRGVTEGWRQPAPISGMLLQ
jgi:hypothetical protein